MNVVTRGSGIALQHPRVQFHEKAQYLFEPHDYKVGHGGRNALKSWAFARALIVLAAKKKLYIGCGREHQASIRDSVHKLLSDQIEAMGYGFGRGPQGQPGLKFFNVLDYEIRGVNGSTFAFFGIKKNINSIKSVEGLDIFWVEEGEAVTFNSWETLLPTLRRDAPYGPFGQGSEVWITFNPRLATDDTYKRWVVDPLPGTKVVEWNWRDAEANGWLSKRAREMKDAAFKKDPDHAANIWDGKVQRVLKGAIFAKEIATAIEEGRLSPKIKEDKTKPCIFSFDLGDSDKCSWWAWQQIGMEHNLVDHYSNTGEGIDHYLNVIEARGHKVKYILLPHDAAQAHQAARGHAKGNTIEKQVRAVYPEKVRLVPKVSVVNRINAARQLFPRINIAEAATKDGVEALTHFQYDVDENTGERSKLPLENWAIHDADAFTYYPVWLKEGSVDDRPPPRTEYDLDNVSYQQSNNTGWLGR